MRSRIGIGAVAARQGGALAARNPGRPVSAGSFRQLCQVRLDFAKLGHVRGQPAGVAEHVLGAQEQPRAGVSATDEDKARGEIPRGL